MGVLAYYLMIYGDQSEVAHAGDAFQHFDIGEDGAHGLLDLAPASEGIGGRLHLACLVFLSCLTGIHNRLKWDTATESALDAFAARLGMPSSS